MLGNIMKSKPENPFIVEGLQYGIVSDLNDPKGLNRVKLILPMLADKGLETDYVPVVTPMAAGKDSNTYGTIWIPDKGEYVLVGFIGGRVERPVVLGSLYNNKCKPFQKVDKDKNHLRAFKSKSEVLFQLDEKDNKPQISIETKKGIRIHIDEDKEAITMTDKDKKNSIILDMKNGAIQITADKKIEFKAGQDTLVLEGNKGLTLKSSGGDLNADVNNVKLAAKANLEAKGNAGAKLEASGQLALKGNPAQIN